VNYIINKIAPSFYWFYTYLGKKIYINLLLSVLLGLFDSFGLTMFLPLLQTVSGEGGINMESMGNLQFFLMKLKDMGISLNLVSIMVLMVSFFIIKGFVKYGTTMYLVLLQQELIRKIRLRLLTSLNHLNFKYFVTGDVGRIQNTMTGEVDRVQRAYQSYFQAFEQIALVVVYFLFAFFIDFQFALLVTVAGAISNLFYKMVYQLTKEQSRKLTDDSNTYQGKVIQYVAFYKYLRSTAVIVPFVSRLEDVILKIEKSRKKIGQLNGLLQSVREPLLITVIAIVIFIQLQVFQGNVGPIVISLLFFYRAISSLTIMQNAWNGFLEASGSIENLQDLQKGFNDHQLIHGKDEFDRLTTGIEIKNMTFSYGSTMILDDINLYIPKNKSVAFVGESGSGKTTLVNVICGLLPIDKGAVLIDGKPIQEIDPISFQNRIGYITQEPVIFNDSIFNNVTLWAKETPENLEKCRLALRKAAILDYIEELPDELNSALGNNGINLSGGQKQRISIARELYKDVDILIMDEATSALDSESEKYIQNQIESLSGGFTILIVAHRLSTIKNADYIVIVKNGKIDNSGTFDELLVKAPNFKKMIELQEVLSN
jgi:ABC-type multidrug transport system fused ATPase/permease subunit